MNSGEDPRQKAIEDALATPELRSRLAQAIASELEANGRRRWRPFIAGLLSGSVAAVAFVLPSLQDQWNAWRANRAVERYDEIGKHLMQHAQYHAAEEAFARALELAGGQRIDLLQEQLRAHVEMMNDDERWPGKVPADLRESDFVYLLELETEPGQQHERSATLAVYGAFLASGKRDDEAFKALREAISLDPQNISAHLNLGNLLADRGQAAEAEREYRQALAINPADPGAHYNLGTLLEDGGRLPEAEQEFRRYIQLAPHAADGPPALAEVLKKRAAVSKTHAAAR